MYAYHSYEEKRRDEETRSALNVMAAPTAEDVHEAFRFFDMDKDQKLSKSEFKILSQSLGGLVLRVQL